MRSWAVVRIAMLLHKSVEHDSRVRREARALAGDGHQVTVLHLPPARGALDGPLHGYVVRAVTPPAWVRRALPASFYRLACLASFVRALAGLRPDVVHAHDAAMLAPGWAGAQLAGARLLYDSHEYAAGVPYRERGWALLVTALERLIVPHCAAVITVSDGIAARLRERYRLVQPPTVLRNMPELAPDGVASVAPSGLRARLAIGDGPLVLHQGAIAPGRGCEQLVRAIAELPDAHLVFLGDAWPGHGGRLERLAAELRLDERVHFVPSVPIAELAACTGEATVGVSLLADSCDNHRLALPNKVFEYIAAGVPIVASDLPELRALIERHGVGRLADPADPSAIARAIAAAIADRESLAVAVERARGALSWERERERLTGLYRRLDGSAPAGPAGGASGVESGTCRPNGPSAEPERRPRALVLVRNAVTHDARVQREARLLAELGWNPLIVGVAAGGQPAGDAELAGRLAVRRLVPLPRLGRLHRSLVSLDWYRRGAVQTWRERPALVHCNDYNTMWIGVFAKLARRSRVVYDAHELWPDRNLRREWRPWLLACEALFVRIADRTVTTSPGYARVIARRYRVPAPVVVRNVPDTEPLGRAAGPADLPRPPGSADPPRPGDPAAELGPPPRANGQPGSPGDAERGRRQLAVYFGAITRGRGLERMVAALVRHERLELRLVGPEAWGFRGELDELARKLGVRDRVELADPVPPHHRDTVLADADVGLALIEPVCLSYELTVPNKLFEYMVAGLPALATDLPEIAAVVEDTGAGVTVDCHDDASLDAGLRAVLAPAVNGRLRAAARRAAARLTWRAESEVLAGVYRELGTGAPNGCGAGATADRAAGAGAAHGDPGMEVAR